MIVCNGSTVYHVFDLKIELVADETAYGWQTVAEVDGKYHYLGNVLVNIKTAIDVWQRIKGKILNQSEIEEVLIENGLKSLAI